MEVFEVLALIEKIIEEHRRIITRGLQTLEQVANDATVVRGLDASAEVFMPGRFDQSQGLQKFDGLLEIIERGLHTHFNREETVLPIAVEEYGDGGLMSGFRSLLLAHEGLRNRIAHLKKSVAELVGGGLSRHVWEASAHDMRAYLSHTRKLLEAHARSEQKLLRNLRDRLKEKAEEKL
jgi:hypothetical protein